MSNSRTEGAQPLPWLVRLGSEEALARTSALMGGSALLGMIPRNLLEAHALLRVGLPESAVQHLVAALNPCPQADVLNVIGLSRRALRARISRSSSVDRGASGRAWQLAQLAIVAADVLGDPADAGHWLSAPAIGLDGMRPIELATSPAGLLAVIVYLDRIDQSSYA